MIKDETRRYCAIIAYVPSIGKDKVDLEINKFKSLIKEMSGIFEKFEYLGLKNLSYEIKKYNTAHYVQYYFKLNNDKHLKHNLSEINRKLGATINQNTIRMLVTKINHDIFNFESLKNFTGFENQIKV